MTKDISSVNVAVGYTENAQKKSIEATGCTVHTYKSVDVAFYPHNRLFVVA